MSGKLTLWQVIKSVLAAMFGVQNSQDRERDFTHGNPWIFIIVGVATVMLFILLLYGIVRLVLASVK